MIEILVAYTIVYEASNQSFECQQWVAKTIETRSYERGLTHKEVCFQPHQFSCWDEDGQPTQDRVIQDYEISTAIRAWMRRNEIKEQPNLYHDISVTPYWTKAKSVTFLKQIGKIRFYREKR